MLLQEAAKVGVSLEGVQIVDPLEDPNLDRYVDALVEARKKKGLTREAAQDLLTEGNFFGTMMVRCGDADGLVSGAAHTTAATVRPGMQARASHALQLPLHCVAAAQPACHFKRARWSLPWHDGNSNKSCF